MSASMVSNTSESAFGSLVELLSEIEMRVLAVERECSQLRLLFRPWPRSNNDAHDIQEKPEEKNPQGKISEEEKKELQLMDKLLSKAQKAREIQRKLEEPPKSYARHSRLQKENKTSENVSTDISNSSKSRQKLEISQEQSNSSDVVSTHGSSSETNRPQSKMSSKVDRLPNKTNPQKVDVQSKTSKNINNPQKVSTKNKKPSLNHLKAPFQTNPSLSFPQKSTNQQAMCQGTQKQKYGLKPAKSAATYPSKVSQSSLTAVKNVQGAQKSDGEVQNSAKLKHAPVYISQERLNIEDTDKPTLQDKPNSLGITDDPQNYLDATETVVTQTVPQDHKRELQKDEQAGEESHRSGFNLVKDGCTIQVPGKVRKLFSCNAKLRQKVNLSRVTKKVDALKDKQEFIEKVELLFDHHLGYRTTDKVKTLTEEYSILCCMLEELAVDLTRESSVFDVLRTKKLLEFILTQFYQLEEDRLSLDPECIGNLECLSTERNSEFPPKPPSHTTFSWIPDKFSVVYYNHRPPGRLSYKLHKDLDRFYFLHFQIQQQYLQSKIKEMTTSAVLHYITSSDPSSRDYIPLIRSLYTLVSSSQSYPVVIKDMIQESLDFTDVQE